MKTNLANWLSALCAILLIALLVLQAKQKTNFDTLRQEQQTFATATEQREQESHEAVAKLDGQVAILGTNLESRFSLADQQQKEQRAERETNFREMHQQLDDLVNSGALFPDKTKPALEAVALAKAAEQSGDMNLAKIYYLSAVNHAPSEFSHLKGYADIVFRDPAATTEDFGHLKSVLQISLYQIPPASVTNALTLLSQTEQRENQLITAQTPKPVPINWQEQFDQIAKALPLDATWGDLKKLSKRWEGLNQIAESLREEPLQTNLLGRVENEAELTQNVLTASRLAQVMDAVFQSLETSVEHQPEKAVSLLQTAEATLGQLWGINFNVAGWPKALSEKVDAYPKAIQNYVEKVAEVKSEPFVNQIRGAVFKANSYKMEQVGNKYQRAWEHYDHCLSEVRAAAANISSSAGRKEAENAYEVIGKLSTDIKRRQFDAYQKWAIDRCEDAFDTYKSFNTMTHDHAWKCFNDGQLVKIDQTLLSPDVSRMFNDVMSKITVDSKGHMWGLGGEDVFSMQKQSAEAQKQKLEDF